MLKEFLEKQKKFLQMQCKIMATARTVLIILFQPLICWTPGVP